MDRFKIYIRVIIYFRWLIAQHKLFNHIACKPIGQCPVSTLTTIEKWTLLRAQSSLGLWRNLRNFFAAINFYYFKMNKLWNENNKNAKKITYSKQCLSQVIAIGGHCWGRLNSVSWQQKRADHWKQYNKNQIDSWHWKDLLCSNIFYLSVYVSIYWKYKIYANSNWKK